jgi:hypothetical protein
MSGISRLLAFTLFLLIPATSLAQPTVVCTVSANPLIVRAEGLAEQMGEIVIDCSGGAPGSHVTGTLYVFLSVPITNRVDADGITDAVLTADTGSGTPVSTGAVARMTGNGISFGPIDVTLTATQRVTFRIGNVRGAVAVQGVNSTSPIVAAFGTSGSSLLFLQASAIVGIPNRALGASITSASITCYGSPVPGTVSMSGLFAAGTRFSTVRVSGGFRGAFEKRTTGADSGMRVVLNFTNFPAGMRLYVPDVVAGSDATQPTAAGDLGVAGSGGQYTPDASGSLLLARVAGADASGAGGVPVFTPGAPGSGTVTLDAATEIPLSNGAASVVYEVVDTNKLANENAQIPFFVSLPRTSDVLPPAKVSVALGPISDVAQASETAPIPRFIATTLPPDCNLVGDCALLPTLQVQSPPLEFTGEAGSADQGKWFGVYNIGGGVLSWGVSLTYTTGSGWASLHIDPWGAVFLRVKFKDLEPGVYEATITVDAGEYAGIENLPVKLTVTAPAATVQIDSIGHAATYATGPVVPGSLAMLKGYGFSGQSVAVTFDALPATLLYASDTQINLQVPPARPTPRSLRLQIPASSRTGW